MTKEILGKFEIDYQYNHENRLVKADSLYQHSFLLWPIAGEVSYGYDALGRRVKKEQRPAYGPQTEVKTEYYLYNGLGLDILADYKYQVNQYWGGIKGELSERTEYYYGNGLLLASAEIQKPQSYQYPWGWTWSLPHCEIDFYHHDVLGSVVMLTDKNGWVKERNQYDIWGKAYEGKFTDGFPWYGQKGNVYGFTGQRYQPELGVYAFAYRDYSPRTMRWLTEDPVKDGGNWYRYCNNNPVNLVDLYGLETWLIHGTWSDPNTFPQEFETAVGEHFNDTITRFEWSGDNTDVARRDAAERLVNEVLGYTLTNPEEPVNMVGHSHGGNVAIVAANTLASYGVEVDTLVTLGTPVRNDYQLTGNNVNSHTQVYNPYDFTQVLGGNLISLPGIGEVGPAGRTFDNAQNIQYSYYGNIFNITAPFTQNHGVFYNEQKSWETWLPQVAVGDKKQN